MDSFKKRTETDAVSGGKQEYIVHFCSPENKTGVKLVSNLKKVMILDNSDVCKPLILQGLQKNRKKLALTY